MRIPQPFLAFSVFVAVGWSAVSVQGASVPEIGAHQPILTVEKNVNPQNKMVV
jgi:hypothetical protein